MESQNRDKDFIKKAKDSLDHGEKNIDPSIQAQLNRIRQEAINRGRKGRFNWRKWTLLPLPALTAAAIAIFAISTLLINDSGKNSFRDLEDIEILVSNQNLDFYDDLDFYAWLDEENLNAG